MADARLYFHSACFDGCAAAALALDVLESQWGWRDVELQPVNYDIRREWLHAIAGRFAVVDFLYHPAAAFWADHHSSPFVNADVEQHHRLRMGESALFDPSAASCAGILWRAFENVLRVRSPEYPDLVAWADKIDSASYTSIEEALFSPVPAMVVSRSLVDADAALMTALVRRLRRESLNSIANTPEIRARSDHWLDEQQRGLSALEKVARLSPDGIVLFEVDARQNAPSRYAPFYLFRDARYSLGLLWTPVGPKLTAMRNPWLPFESVPLGDIFSRVGGGGHRRVGSVLLPNIGREHALAVMQRILSMIQQPDREQYAGR